MPSIVEGLGNYRHFLARLDQRCREIMTAYQPYIVCAKGCDTCCRHISVFAVEAVAMAHALSRYSQAEITLIRKQALSAEADGPCPLLSQGACLLYQARPVICRTHGLPIILSQKGKSRVDFCPKNFSGLSTLPGDAAIYLDRVNETLASINRLFTTTFLPDILPMERFTMAEVLLLEMGDEFEQPHDHH